MTEISAAAVRELRETTGCGMMDCKKALVEAGGDVAKAKELLRQKGLQTAGKKGSRSAGEGVVGVYRHHDLKRAVLVELNCETDFVARNEKFQQLAADFAMHVCATNPEYLSREEVPADIVKKEEELILHSDEVMAKPEAARPKIVEGKLRKFYEQQCLLDQRFVKDDSKTIQDVINDSIANLGENIRLRRFVKFEIGG